MSILESPREAKLHYLAACLVLGGMWTTSPVSAQIPTKCFEIESILVDACESVACPGAAEGENEMVRIRIGPAPIDPQQMFCFWPNNAFLGFVQNAQTAALVAQVNSSIQSCGHLLEPPVSGLPPGSQAIIFTSTDVCIAANPFTSLGDTLYALFQAPGNTSGHFANHNNGGVVSPVPVGPSSTRTLIIEYTPTFCSDTAIYDRPLLVNVFGTYGGSSAENDGATVEFSWPGTPVPTYLNRGCQAPFVPLSASGSAVGQSICGDPVDMEGSSTGPVSSVFWSGGAGTFSQPDSLNTAYTPALGEGPVITLTFCVVGACQDTVCSLVDVQVIGQSMISITPDGPPLICGTDSLLLEVNATSGILWNTGDTTQSIYVQQAGTYWVDVIDACGTGTDSLMVSAAPPPVAQITPDGPTTFCQGDSVVLVASGGDPYLWSTGVTDTAIVVNTSGLYWVTVTDQCGSSSDTVEVTVQTETQAIIVGDTILCPGDTLVLTASGGDQYRWDDGTTVATLTVSSAGTYSVVVSGLCGVDTATITVVQSSVVAAFSADVVQGIAPLDVQFTNASTGADQYTWDLGDTNTSTAVDPMHQFVQPGTFTVLLIATDTLGCADEASLVIVVSDGSFSVSVANVFSPNGDGVNDVFRVQGSGIAELSMDIWNRWGQIVGRLTRPNEVWDATTFAGEIVPEGTYFYVLMARGTQGEEEVLKGTITLVR